MTIHPYPNKLVTRWQLKDGTPVVIRPLKPEDAALEQDFVQRLSPATRYLRFMNALRELSPAFLSKLTQIDYDREFAFLATIERDGAEYEIGVCRYAANPDGSSCEFAIVIADEFQHAGLGRKLMQVLIDTAHGHGFKTMQGIFLASNDNMLKFAKRVGFALRNDPDDGTIKHGVLDLGKAATIAGNSPETY